MHAIDLSPIVNAAVSVAATVVAACGYWVARKITHWLGLRAGNEVEAAFDAALEKGIQAGAAAAENLIREKGWDHAETKSAILAFAAPYVIGRVPGLLRHFGLDPSDPAATRDFVMRELDRVFPTAIAPVAHSPVTPPIGIPAAPSAPGTTADDYNRAELASIAQGG